MAATSDKKQPQAVQKKDNKPKSSPLLFFLNPRFLITLVIIVLVLHFILRHPSDSFGVLRTKEFSIGEFFSGWQSNGATGDSADSYRARANLDKLNLSSDALSNPIYHTSLPLGVVVVKNANLRSEPASNSAAIMTVEKGTRLPIKARGNDWLKVLTPKGGEAWVLASSVVIPGK